MKSVGRPTWLADGRTMSLGLDRRDVAHWSGQLLPVVLTVYDASSDVVYWADVRQYFERLPGFRLSAAAGRVIIHLSKDDVFDPVAVERIRQLKNAVVRRIVGGSSHD